MSPIEVRGGAADRAERPEAISGIAVSEPRKSLLVTIDTSP